MQSIIDWWNRLEGWVTGSLAAIAIVVFLYGMIARFAFPELAPDWVLEVTIFLLVWAVLLSASSLVDLNRHVRADLVVRVLPATIQWILEIFCALVAAAFCVLLVVSGIEVLEFAVMLDERTLNTLRIPMVYYYASVPVAFALVALRYLVRIGQLAQSRKPTPLHDTIEDNIDNK